MCVWEVTGLLTSALAANGSPVAGTGFDFADFLLGLPQSSSIRYGDSSVYLRQNVWAGFAQDDWKVRPSLTLNSGLRYESSTDAMSNFMGKSSDKGENP